MPTIPKNEELQKQLENIYDNFKLFLESFPLYKKCKNHVPSKFDNFKFHPLQLNCIGCKKETTHCYRGDLSQVQLTPIAVSRGGGSKANIKLTNGNTVKLTYKCQLCNIESYHFQVSFKNDQMYKSGQEPSIDVSLSPDIEDRLGDSLSKLYRKGKTCVSHGFGIGAMAYYRRVVEDKVHDILEDIKEFLPEDQQEQFEKEIDGVKGLHNFDQKADVIYEAMPDILKPKGENLLKLLFGLISENLHAKSDDECLEIAEETSSLLEVVIEKLNSEAKAQKALAKIKKSIEKRK